MSFLRLATTPVSRTLTHFKVNTIRCFAASAADKSTERDTPVKFSTSKAKSHNPMDTFIAPNQRGKSQVNIFIVLGSFMVVMVYAAFREENSLDRIFEKSLEQTVPNVKEMTLRNEIKKYEDIGLDTRKLRLALNEEIESKKIRKV